MDFFSSKRIWIDLETREMLDFLSDVHTNIYKSRERLLNRIMCEWVYSEERKCEKGYGFRNDIMYSGYKASRIFLSVEDNIWNDFIRVCFKRELDVSTGFKTAVFNFVDNIEMLEH